MFMRAKSVFALGLSLSTLVLGTLGFSNSARAGVVVSVDWDSALAGIQSSIDASPGDTLFPSIVLQFDGTTSVSVYAISARFSTGSLDLISRNDFDSSGTGGFPVGGNSGSDVLNTNLADPVVGNYGELRNISGFILAGNGPSTGTYVSTNLTFNVLPGAVSGPAILPGIFTGNDFFFDNGSNDVTAQVTFNAGSLNVTAVPEPSTVALVSTGLVLFGFQRVRRRFVK